MIQVSSLVKDFGSRRAVDGISFTVEPGTVLGFLGPNGAGKTTSIRMIAGFLPPTSGTALVHGVDVVRNSVTAQKLMGYMPENTPLYEDMTVEAFLKFIAEIRGFRGRDAAVKAGEAIERCFLQAVRRQSVDTLSKGYRQRTGLAQALLHDPKVLLLDEPTEGLDPNQKQVVRNMISHMGKEKIIMLSTHVLEEVEAVCSRIIIISNGRIVADSTPANLCKRSALYNTLTLEVAAPEKDAVSTFEQQGDIASVEVTESGDHRARLTLTPKDQQPIAPRVLDIAREKGWLVTEIHSHPGRLDDVFRQLTTTDDVTEQARKTA